MKRKIGAAVLALAVLGVWLYWPETMNELLVDVLAALMVFGPGILTFLLIVGALFWFLSLFSRL